MYEQPPGPSDVIHISLPSIVRVNCAAMFRNKKNWEIAEEAIDDWMRKNSPDQFNEPEFAGYQWKELFLPQDTVLRTTFNGKHHYSHVQGDRIMYEKKALSPSGFANAVGGVRRNAWKCVWVLLPHTGHWQLADRMRVRRRPVSVRKSTHGARPPAAPPAVKQAQHADPKEKAAPTPRPAQARPSAPAFARWASRRKPRRLLGGGMHALVSLLRHARRE